MSIRNKVTLIGRTGKEVEMVKFENGQLAKVSLATSEHYTNAKGEKVEETQWHNLVCYGKTAEIMEKYDIAANRRVRGLGRHQVAGLKSEFN